MKQLLCIAYYFPPQGGGGVQRVAKFVKYLPRFGWQPTVLTGSAPGALVDPSLDLEVPASTRVVRVRGWVLPPAWPWRLRHWLKRWCLVVDEQIGWLPFAVRQGLALLRTRSYSALYSTSAPYSDHLVALRLKRTTQLPWVADFRDPWIDNFSIQFATSLHQSWCARLEREIVSTADRVLVVSEPMRQKFLDRYPQRKPQHIITLPNGFDPADYEGVAPAARDERFTLVYTGSLYGPRNAGSFLAAVSDLLERGVIPRSNLSVRFVGNIGPETAQQVARWQLTDVVELRGYVPHRQTIAHQLAADLLVLIIGSGPGSESVLTAKIFEYLASGKPILALIPPGAAADLLAEAGVGQMVPPDEPEAIAVALADLFVEWQQGRLQVTPDPLVVARYNRQLQTAELAHILDELADERR